MLRRLIPGLSLLALSACVVPPQVVYVPQAPIVACDTRFNVVNQSNRTVERLYFSSSALNSWGEDQLGQGVLPPGRSAFYQPVTAGAHDFRIVWANGRDAEIRGVDVCVASRITITNSGLRAG